ncbi:MAG: substrate-binding domain-containing protein, partial [Chloroflexota bacterium]|nr:substrate-binding domain-containing protein [Chloroflexota bacterium]
NPGTVVRAYLQLEQEGMVVSRHGGGTIVSARADDPRTSVLRRSHLSSMVSGNVLEALSLGYSPEELEAAFSLHLARWREERKDKEKASGAQGSRVDSRNSLLIVGSNDLALNLLVSKLKHRNPETNIEVTNAGSLGGLIALREGRADLAGIHLLDEESGEYNYPYVKHVLPGVEMAIVHFTYRIQGFMFAKGNPKQIRGLEDLRRPEVTMVNRQKGSGTRVLLDFKLRELGILPGDIKGYQHEEDTHLAVAGSIARGEADVGLGIEAAARSRGTDFLPLFRERYDLVIPVEKCRSKPVLSLLEITKSEEFRKVVTEMGGYDTSETGTTVFVS